MSLKLLKLTAFIGLLFFAPGRLWAQGNFTGINKTVINLPCSQSCTNLNFQVPHLKSDDDYQVVSIPYTPYAYTTGFGNELTALYADDKYSQAITLPFPICFYGSVYTQVVVGSNGLLTFDVANANCDGAYRVIPTIPFSGGAICNQNIIYYPQAAVMGNYSDLDPQPSSSPPERKIEWRFEGTAPFRRFVASWYKVGVYGNNACGTRTPTTFQIVINEATSVIEVFFEDKTCQDASTGLAILGIQNWTRTKAVAAINKNATSWTARNEGYRFVPSGGTSRFVKSELYLLNGITPIATAATATPTPGLIDIGFGNVCIASNSQQYVVKTVYSSCINPAIPIIIEDTVTISKTPMSAIASGSPTTCTGVNNGSISINPTGTAPFTFSLDGAPAVAGAAPYTFFNVSAGRHTVIAYDGTGCQTDPIDIDIAAGPPLTTIVTSTDAKCYASFTGTITVTQPAIGTAPFEYSLNGTTWQTSNVFNNLQANSYTVYYREANGCQGSQMAVINQPPPLTATDVTIPVICNGQNNGTITVTASGGTAPYQYSLDGITWQSSNILQAPAGPYTVTIKDNNNCTTTRSGTLTQPPAMTATAVTTNASCNGGNDGTITVTASGGNTNYQYSIDGTTFQASNVFNVIPGTYTITVKDNLGCTFSFGKTVGLTNDLVFTPQRDEIICESKSVQLELVSNAIQYSWTPATGLSRTDIPNPVASPTVTTPYTVIATLGQCTATDIVTVNVNPAPIPDAGQNAFICYGQTYTLQGNGGVQYTWTPSTYLSSATGRNPVSTPAKTITYTLSKIIDANGCESLTTDDIVLDVTPPVKVTTFPYDTIAYPGDQFEIRAVAAVPNANIFTWTPATRLSNAGIYNPQVTVGDIGQQIPVGNTWQDQVYQVTAETAAGCKGEGYVRIRVYKGPDIYVPTGFTPNHDGRNDKFIPIPVGLKSITYFKVFNRWGNLIFTSTRLHDGWDGTINGLEQPTGTYVWMVEGITKDNKTITKKGTVTLIR